MEAQIKNIKDSLALPVCSGWDRNFLESLLEQITMGRVLSEKQISTLSSVLLRNSPESQKQHEHWVTVYAQQYADEAVVLAKYYKSAGYFKSLVESILANHVPDRAGFLKMYSNKYAQKVLTTFHAEPKYNVGDYIFPRASFSSSKAMFDESTRRAISWTVTDSCVKRFKSKGGLIIELHDTIVSAANGAKTYKILPIGSTIPFIIEERFIKSKRT